MGQHIHDRDERHAGKGVFFLEDDAEYRIRDVEGHQDRQSDEEADEQFLGGAGIFERLPVDLRVRPQMPAHLGDEPEAIEAEGGNLEKAAGDQELQKLTAPP